MGLRFRPGLGEPFGRHGNGDEQQPDQRAGHAGAPQEEFMNGFRNHLVILAVGESAGQHPQAFIGLAVRVNMGGD
jgi:hypothetical protein